MQTNILAIAATLPDDDLLARLPVLARKEREVSAELVAHLAVLDTRAALYAADGYGSLFSYCTRPDAPSLVRKLPPAPRVAKAVEPSQESGDATAAPPVTIAAPLSIARPAPRPIVEVLAPQRYRVQFTAGECRAEEAGPGGPSASAAACPS